MNDNLVLFIIFIVANVCLILSVRHLYKIQIKDWMSQQNIEELKKNRRVSYTGIYISIVLIVIVASFQLSLEAIIALLSGILVTALIGIIKKQIDLPSEKSLEFLYTKRYEDVQESLVEINNNQEKILASQQKIETLSEKRYENITTSLAKYNNIQDLLREIENSQKRLLNSVEKISDDSFFK